MLPFLELICNTEEAVDELIDVVGNGFRKLYTAKSQPICHGLLEKSGCRQISGMSKETMRFSQIGGRKSFRYFISMFAFHDDD